MSVEEEPTISKCVFRCPQCSYYRYVVSDRMARAKKIYHRIYGQLSLAELAEREVKHHDCEEHEQAKQRIQAVCSRWLETHKTNRYNYARSSRLAGVSVGGDPQSGSRRWMDAGGDDATAFGEE